MMWMDVSEKEEKELATYGITEGEYPAAQEDLLITVPVPEDEANVMLKFVRENGVLRMGISEEICEDLFDPGEYPKGIDILSYEEITGKIKDRNIAFISIF